MPIRNDAQRWGWVSLGIHWLTVVLVLCLCAVGLLPLGLPASDPFWSAPAEPWTSKALWSGADLPPDHAL